MTIYRADQVGSFLRPKALLDSRDNPGITPEELARIEDGYIEGVLKKQQELGFHIFSDGELRRATFMSDFNEAVEGMDQGDAVGRAWTGAQGQAARNLGVAVGKIRARRRMTQHETDFMKAHSPGDIKMTLPSANQFPAIAFKKGVTDAFYRDFSEFLWDCVPVVRDEVKALVEQDHVAYVQLDAPRYSYYIDPKWRDYVKNDMGMEPESALDEAIRADNACLEGVHRDGLTTCIHLCRGNNRSQWYAEGGYDPIAEKLFNQLNVDAFSLEYETERSGSFEPLRFVPRGKIVVLGLISSKVPELESADAIVSRIEEAAKYVPLEQLTLSPQCGFASMAEGNLLTEEEQWRKLALVAEVARRVWGTT